MNACMACARHEWFRLAPCALVTLVAVSSFTLQQRKCRFPLYQHCCIYAVNCIGMNPKVAIIYRQTGSQVLYVAIHNTP
jgi:hypothetical protein